MSTSLHLFDMEKVVPAPCECTRPGNKPDEHEMKLNKLDVGTRIRCPQCGAVYEWCNEQRDGYYWKKV